MDEDFFSDDPTLDALPEDELQALEDAAVKSTQQPVQTQYSLHPIQQNQYQQSQYQQAQPDSRAISRGPPYYNYAKPPPPQLPVGPPQQQQQSKIQQWSTNYNQYRPYNHQRNNQLPTPQNYIRKIIPRVPENAPSSDDDYGGFDETSELWDAVAPKAQTQTLTQDLNDQQYYAEDNGEVDQGRRFDNSAGAYHLASNNPAHDDRVSLVGGDVMVGVELETENRENERESTKLMARVSELQKEKEILQKEIASVRDVVSSKNGEISVVRTNKAKSEATLKDAIAQAEQKRNEEREKYKLHIEAIEAESERTRTEITFLRKEIEEIARQGPRNIGRKTARHQVLTVGESGDFHSSLGNQSNESHKSPATTPRRNKGYAFRDGFEDSEMLSPSKAKCRSPMRPGIKRKRPLIDSPKMSGTSSKDPRMMPVDHAQMQFVEEMLLGRLLIEDDRFDFFKAVMAHRPAPGMERSLDNLRKFSFPSSPETSISSLLQDQIALLQETVDKSELSAGVCKALLYIWRRCLTESLHGPLKSILNLFEFGVLWDQGGKCYKFFDEAVFLFQQTVDVNAMPMLRRNTELLDEDIDIDLCLRLLEGIALGLFGDEKRIKMFWKLIRSDFPLMILNPHQRLPHIQRMASLLSTSCLGDSFGSVVSNEMDQRTNEGHLIDAVTKLLVNTPRAILNKPGYTKLEIIGLRKQILQLLGCISGMEIGLSALAKHPTALTRLIKRMADELEEIYECKFGREQSVQLVNLAMRLLHSILKIHGQPCMSKIATPNTSHKYLVAMTRLAFSEGLSQELGIDESTRRFAQEILETTTTPEEAENLEMLFSPSSS